MCLTGVNVLNPTTGALVREIGGGPARSELRLKDPRGIDMDSRGRLYICDAAQLQVVRERCECL